MNTFLRINETPVVLPLSTQTLLDDAESCKNKMVAASALINGLGGEKVRWTQQSKEFQEQIGR